MINFLKSFSQSLLKRADLGGHVSRVIKGSLSDASDNLKKAICFRDYFLDTLEFLSPVVMSLIQNLVRYIQTRILYAMVIRGKEVNGKSLQ